MDPCQERFALGQLKPGVEDPSVELSRDVRPLHRFR
jgi:hypothetical protein